MGNQKLLADESVDYRIVKNLRLNGYSVDAIIEDYQGIKDEEVLKIANSNNAILLTEDKDFGELTYRFQLQNKGIILLRMSGLSVSKRISKINKVLSKYNNEIRNSFTVITEFKVRIRKP